jgi:hypothetical protein
MWRTAVAAVLLLAALYLLRYALVLREGKRERERARDREEAEGRKVLAEIPLADDDVVLLTEDTEAFRWGDREVRKADVVGARLLVNGTVFRETEGPLPPLPPPQPHDGRDVWEVAVYRRPGGEERIPCGTMREGVSRDIALRTFGAVSAVVAPGRTS